MSEARERLLSTSITTSATFDPAGEPIGSVSFSVRQIEDDGFYDLEVVRRFFGGTKPLNSATIYRGIAEGRYPRPVRVSPNANRWLGRELKNCRDALINEARKPLPSPRRFALGESQST